MAGWFKERLERYNNSEINESAIKNEDFAVSTNPFIALVEDLEDFEEVVISFKKGDSNGSTDTNSDLSGR